MTGNKVVMVEGNGGRAMAWREEGTASRENTPQALPTVTLLL